MKQVGCMAYRQLFSEVRLLNSVSTAFFAVCRRWALPLRKPVSSSGCRSPWRSSSCLSHVAGTGS
ncbi:hypothetical protein AMK22_17605 [Streptomyces sp. CB01580]|nr:hypothetical protein AMK22_17605 [Streptomyces sp. CB01580]